MPLTEKQDIITAAGITAEQATIKLIEQLAEYPEVRVVSLSQTRQGTFIEIIAVVEVTN